MFVDRIVTCGASGTDFPGWNNAAIQRAIACVSATGGGIVRLSEGEYLLQDSVHLCNNVTLEGAGIDRTIFVKNASVQGKTKFFCGYGHREIIVEDSSLFRSGDGIYVKQDGYYGFHATQTTIVDIDSDTLYLAQPLNSDVHGSHNGLVTTVFPMIKGDNCENVRVRNLTLEGNAENNHFLEGCRGGAIYLIACKDVFVDCVKITNFHGEGFSYQQCQNIRIENSECTYNRGNGLHPGSGTVGMVIRNCDISYNDRAGIHNCLRVSYQICAGNRICNNGLEGIEIGHRDDYLEIFGNEIIGNGSEGIYFREDDCPGMSGRYVSIHGNRIEGNGKNKDTAQIYAPSALVGLQLYGNIIGGEASFVCEDKLSDSYLWDNQCKGTISCKNDREGKYIHMSAPESIRVVDVECIPEKAYRHL